MYWNDKDRKYLHKMHRNHLLRQTPYFRRNLAVDKVPTDIKVIKIKSRDDVMEIVGGYNSLPIEVCYFLGHVNSFSTLLFHSVVDIVATDMYDHAVGVFESVKPDKIVDVPKTTRNIWIFATGSINYLSIKMNSLVNTKS